MEGQVQTHAGHAHPHAEGIRSGVVRPGDPGRGHRSHVVPWSLHPDASSDIRFQSTLQKLAKARVQPRDSRLFCATGPSLKDPEP